MKSSALKVLTLFFVLGLASGLFSIFVSSLSSVWMWLGLGGILLPGLLLSIVIARGLGWLSLKLNVWRSVSAALIIVAAYPISVLVLLGSIMLYEWLYSKTFPQQWGEHIRAGSYPFSMWSLYVAAIVGAVLVSVALRVLTKKWDKQVMLLLILASLGTIPLSQGMATLMSEPNWHLVIFPVGEALFSALCGYWLLRASPIQEHGVSSPATTPQPHQRPA